MSNYDEKRQFRRMFFTVEDGIFTSLKFPEKKDLSVTTNILSISEGGLSFIVHKEAVSDVIFKEKVVLEKVLEPDHLTFLENMTVEVRHSISDEELNHIICGCQFTDMNEKMAKKIRGAMSKIDMESEDRDISI